MICGNRSGQGRGPYRLASVYRHYPVKSTASFLCGEAGGTKTQYSSVE